jgi:XisI protein
MGRVDEYRGYIEKMLRKYAEYKPSYGEIEVQTIFDRENNHYQLMHVGWHDNRRIYGCILHLDIKDNKIWIQHNGTELAIADELVEIGVPKEDIVLAFHAPYKRKYTGFAVG